MYIGVNPMAKIQNICMKRFNIILLLICITSGLSAQSFYDDVYYTPSVKTTTKTTTTTTTTVTTTTQNGGSSRDVDEYNRFYSSGSQNNVNPVDTMQDFTYTSQIIKYYNPDVVPDSTKVFIQNNYYYNNNNNNYINDDNIEITFKPLKHQKYQLYRDKIINNKIVESKKILEIEMFRNRAALLSNNLVVVQNLFSLVNQSVGFLLSAFINENGSNIHHRLGSEISLGIGNGKIGRDNASGLKSQDFGVTVDYHVVSHRHLLGF